MNRKKIIIVVIILLAVLMIIKELVDFFPYFMMGAPFGVFGVNNMDSAKHNINIKLFDSKDKLLLNETYNLLHSETVSYPEAGWKDVHEKDRLFPDGIYTFLVTLDGNVTEKYQETMDTWSSPIIYIENNGNIQIRKIVE